MLDADHFKAVNDAYGHALGDEVLRRVAATCRAQMRAGDYAGRLGGEEFALVLRDTGEAAGMEIAERLRAQIGAETYATPQGRFAITVSSGVATLGRGVATIEELLRRADAALYRAKAGGRNRTVAHGPGGHVLRLAV